MRASILHLFLLVSAIAAEQVQNAAPFERLRTLSKTPSVAESQSVHTLATCTGSPLSGPQVGFRMDNGCSSNPDDPAPSGRVCTFTCVAGYNNNDNIQPLGSYRCTDAGSWVVEQAGTCIPQQCYFPYYPPTSGFTFGTCNALLRVGESCILGCAPGFAPQPGTDGLVNCDVDGGGVVTLSTPSLVCLAAGCVNPPLPAHSVGFSDCTNGGETPSGSECHIACQDGYSPSGSLVCVASKWTPNFNPNCFPATCAVPTFVDLLKELGQCGKQTTTTGQSCELGCVNGYEPDIRAGTLVTCTANVAASTATFSPYSYDCVDVNECLIAYPLACGVGWTCTNTIGAFNCSPLAPELDFQVEAKEFYKHYRATKPQPSDEDDEEAHGEGGGEGHSSRSRNSRSSSRRHHGGPRRRREFPRVGEGEGRGGQGGSDREREERAARNRRREQEADAAAHVFIGLKWALGAPTVVTKLELEVSEDINDVVKMFTLPFDNPQAKHVAFKAKKGASYQFTLLVTTEEAGLQRSPSLPIVVPPLVTPATPPTPTPP